MSHQRRVAEHSVRFWASVAPGPPDECWEWAGRRDRSGYGVLSIGPRGAVEPWKAHRLSWELHRGPIPDGLVIRHQCGNRCCVNPHHLIPGTQVQNIADTMQMERVPRGEGHWNGKLTKGAVADIRAGYVAGATRKALAEIHAVGEGAIASVLDGTTWQHVTRGDGLQSAINAVALGHRTHRGSDRGGAKLNEAYVLEIRRRVAAGERQSVLATEFGVSGALIGHVVNGRAWKHVPVS